MPGAVRKNSCRFGGHTLKALSRLRAEMVWIAVPRPKSVDRRMQTVSATASNYGEAQYNFLAWTESASYQSDKCEEIIVAELSRHGKLC